MGFMSKILIMLMILVFIFGLVTLKYKDTPAYTHIVCEKVYDIPFICHDVSFTNSTNSTNVNATNVTIIPDDATVVFD